jgi:hypothetical protein
VMAAVLAPAFSRLRPAGPAPTGVAAVHAPATETALEDDSGKEGDPTTIPPDRRTRPLGIAEAARLMGYKGKKCGDALRRAMTAGAVRFMRLTRQSYVFDRADFPFASQAKLTPTHPKSP